MSNDETGRLKIENTAQTGGAGTRTGYRADSMK
jgi:hypothetical protein